FLLRINVPAIKPECFPPPYLQTMGRRLAWIYSNELPLVREFGAEIEGIEAAWISCDSEHGLNEYANWALSEIQAADAKRRRWLKPTLLATYGLLASKPRKMEFAYRRGRGVTKHYP